MAEGRHPGPRVTRRRSHLLSREPVVLMYHGFTERRRRDDPENLFVEVAQFERQLTWLLASGWRALDLDTYLEAMDSGRRPASRSFLVTIDDGFRSVSDLALPVLERLGVPALFYVPSGLLDATATWLPAPADMSIVDADHLRHLHHDSVLEVGLHGYDHSDMRALDASGLEQQVARARDVLSSAIEAPVRSFAYPFGSHDAAARAAVERSGMQVAFSVYDDAGRFAVSRVDVNATDSLRSFQVKVRLPRYRTVWNALQHAPVVRRGVRQLTTRDRGAW